MEKERKILSYIKQKPYFVEDNFVLYHGDSLELLKDLPENSIDMIFADPPYNLSNGGFTCHAGRAVSVNKGEWDKSKGINDDFDFHLNWIRTCRRVLKSNGTIWITGTYHSIYQCGFALQSEGFRILNEIAWFKPNGSPNLSCRFFTASHETLIWARKNQKGKHFFDYKTMKDSYWPDDFLKKSGSQMRSVWAINTPKADEKKFGKHPTQKPLTLLKRVVLASTKKGDIILDPFAGSSTTGLAAHLYGRKFIGIDKERDYLDLSIRRFTDSVRLLSSKLFRDKI
jgi:site-specific DNA-methyltransferase (adenine-specific)